MKSFRKISQQGGSVIIIVMITLLFTAAALVAFLDKASTDLLVEARQAEASRLRPDAYTALEATLGVLEQFIKTDNGLRAPQEGWGPPYGHSTAEQAWAAPFGDPLKWAGWTPSDGYTVEISFADESGKIPLAHVNPIWLMNLFESAPWGTMSPDAAQDLTDELMTWISPTYSPVSAVAADYEQDAIPFDAPQRPIRSFTELAAIDKVRDQFYDASGRPNNLWWMFYNDFSLYNFRYPNINGANEDVLTAVGQFTPDQDQMIANYLAGTGQVNTLGRTWFRGVSDVKLITAAGTVSGFVYTISALRINVTVHDGASQFRLSAVVAPAQGGGASIILTTAQDVKTSIANSTSGETNAPPPTPQSVPTTKPSSAQTAAAATSNLQYPFTVLEIHENDDIPTPPPAPPAPPDSSAPADTSGLLNSPPSTPTNNPS